MRKPHKSGRARSFAALFLLGLGLAAFDAAAAGDVTFRASVNRTHVPLDDQVKLTVSVSVPDRRKIGYLELPDTGSLEVVGTSREQSTSFSFSGGTSQYQKFTNTVLTLRPVREGAVTIGPAELKYAGRIYKTKPIKVRVTAKRGRARGPSGPTSPFPGLKPRGFPGDDWFRDPFDDLVRRPEPVGDKDIFIRAYASPDLVVEGQQVTVTVIVYSRVGARIAGVRWPKLDPFYSVDRDVSKVPTDEKYIDGVRYQYKVLGRKALFPMQPGEYTIGRVEVEVEASSSPFFPAESRTLRSSTIKVKVEPLPAEGMPEGFRRSNVGRFSLNSKVDTNEVNLNQPVTFTLTVRGTGNIQNLRPPELPALDRFKVFDPVVDVKQAKRGSKVKGSKTFEYILLPLASGKLTIPALKFSFYDPETGRYRTLSTRAEEIEVTALGVGDQGPGSGAFQGREFNIVAGAFKPIRFTSSLRGYGPPFYKHPAFVPLLAVPPLAYLLVLLAMLIRGMVRTDSPRSRMRRARTDARRHLKLAGKAAAVGQATDFYVELKDALMQAVESRTGNPSHGLQLADLQRQLTNEAVPADVIDGLVREIENCDFGRFAPAASRGGEMSSALERGGRLMKSLQRMRAAEAPRGGRR